MSNQAFINAIKAFYQKAFITSPTEIPDGDGYVIGTVTTSLHGASLRLKTERESFLLSRNEDVQIGDRVMAKVWRDGFPKIFANSQDGSVVRGSTRKIE